MSILHWNEKPAQLQSSRPRTQRVERPIRDAVKRAYPAVVVCATLLALLAATIAFRLLIWLPMWIVK